MPTRPGDSKSWWQTGLVDSVCGGAWFTPCVSGWNWRNKLWKERGKSEPAFRQGALLELSLKPTGRGWVAWPPGGRNGREEMEPNETKMPSVVWWCFPQDPKGWWQRHKCPGLLCHYRGHVGPEKNHGRELSLPVAIPGSQALRPLPPLQVGSPQFCFLKSNTQIHLL